MFTQPAPFTAPAPIAPAAPAFEHRPTEEQQAILDAAATGQDITIEAGAGTGKTSTLKMVAAARGKRALYLAYNRAIADDARATFPASVHCATAHSLAFRAVGHRYSDRLNGPRLPAHQVAKRLGIPAVVDLVGGHALTSVKVARLVQDTVRTFCYSDDDEIHTSHVPDVPGLTPEAASALRVEVVPYARRAWADITSPDGRLRFEHDHYLKLWALTRPALPYDVVMLDEAQDANPLIAQIVQAQTAQQILVGDQSQAIYGWRGAVDAMASFGGTRLALTRSWRFGPAIAEEANEWLDLLDAPLRLVGNPARHSALARVPMPDAILARTNAGALAAVMHELEAGRKVAMVGGGDDIRRLAQACQELREGRTTTHPELLAFSSWAEVQEFAENDTGGSDLKVFVRLIDQHGAQGVIAVVDQLTSEETAEVVVSTAHKAKGREWPSVRIAGDFSGEYADPETGEIDQAEVMLRYVAVTRAKDVLDARGLTEPDVFHTRLPAAPVIHSPAPVPAAAPAPLADSAPVTTPGKVELPPEARGWLDLAKQASANAAHWKAIADHAITRLQELAGENAYEATIDGRPAFVWRPSKPAMALDATRLKKERPDIWEAYAKPKKAARPFRLEGEWK